MKSKLPKYKVKTFLMFINIFYFIMLYEYPVYINQAKDTQIIKQVKFIWTINKWQYWSICTSLSFVNLCYIYIIFLFSSPVRNWLYIPSVEFAICDQHMKSIPLLNTNIYILLCFLNDPCKWHIQNSSQLIFRKLYISYGGFS